MESPSNRSRSTHLVVIMDTLPSVRFMQKDENLYEKWMDSVIAFCNFHVLLNAKNELTVIASHLDTNQYLKPDGSESSGEDGQYEQFAIFRQAISEQLKALVKKTRDSLKKREDEQRKSIAGPPESLLAGALCMALCSIEKKKANFDSSRIVVISASNDSTSSFSSQYMNFMNAFFTAQKIGVIIDACIASPDEQLNDFRSSGSILQQGCDITSGLYLKIANVSGLLEYLIWVMLPDAETRSKMVLPSQPKVGYKAACFCHRNLIDVGHVCSVCLSIFCRFNPICSTCHTMFKLGPLPKNIKKKPVKAK